MARYLFTVWPFPGHINPNVAVAVALRERGHDVAFYTGGRVSEVFADLGMPHYPMHHVDEERVYEQHRIFENDTGVGSAFSLAQWRRLHSALHDFLIGTIPGQMADLEPVLDEWRPDVIVCDLAMLAPFLILHDMHNLPVAMLSLSVGCMLPGRDIPAWGRGSPPPTTRLRRLRVAVERPMVAYATRRIRNAASAMRVRYGLAPLTMSLLDLGGTMPLYLVTSVPELDYGRRDLPSHVQYVGRCTWDRPSDQPPPAWISQLPTDRPLIYVTEGTLHARQPKLLQAAAQGLAGLPLQVLMTLNADRDAASAGLTGLAPNVRLEPFMPGRGWQNDILPRTSLVITNGGAGSVLAALAAGIPLIVVPTAWDKPENAQRVVETGAGIRLSASRCSPSRLRAAVTQILGHPSYRANARRIANSLGRVEGAARAAALLEALHVPDGEQPPARQEVLARLP